MLAGKRIIFVFPTLELGGAERQAMLLAKSLHDEYEMNVEVWGFSKPGRTKELCEEYGMKWRIVQNPLSSWLIPNLLHLLNFAWTLRKAKPDIILPYTRTPNLCCCAIWPLTGAKACIWNQRDVLPLHVEGWIGRMAIHNASCFISNSRHGVNFIRQNLKIADKRIKLVPNGVELTPPKYDRREWRKMLGVSDICFIACMVANLNKSKDHDTLLRAWRIVLDQLKENNGPSALLLLAGRFDETHESLIKLSEELELGHHIRFMGKVNDVSGLLNAVDVGILCSHAEGCPNAVLEYMASGLPVVGTDVSGIRETVGNDGNPFLSPSHDPTLLAMNILKFVSDLELRKNAGCANKLRIKQNFSVTKMVANMITLISDYLE